MLTRLLYSSLNLDIQIFFEPRDLWVGVYVKRPLVGVEGGYTIQTIYFLPLPCIGFRFDIYWKEEQ